uniref:Aa_trans domain-containing protein n=1 Tax=Meloidogyne hapla TaxID=6305 RepID=A0A1I8B0S5_MELHA
MSSETTNFEKHPPFIINGNNRVCDEKDIEQKSQEKSKKNGLGWFVACLFVVSDMAGGGLVALPTAMINSGFWPGILLSFLMTLIFMFTSKALGRNWVILRRRWPVYRKHCRQPYPEMGKRALGKWMGLAAVVAVTTTSLAVILICIGSLLDFGECRQHHSMPEFRITNFFLAVGTLLFAYGGHPAFPTIQHDMRKPEEFEKSSSLAFSILFCMYTPVCIIGYMSYGDSLRESVINSLQHVWIQQIVNLMITLHLIFTIIIVNNPLNQKVEEVFNIPHDFGWKRVVARTGMMALALFVAETVPSFGPLLDLIVFGFCGGLAATYSAIRSLSVTHFVPPCYLSSIANGKEPNAGGHVNCCGKYQNISVFGLKEEFCSPSNLNFYS